MTRRRFRARYKYPRGYNTGHEKARGCREPFLPVVARVTLRRRVLRHLRHRRIRELGGGPPRGPSNGLFRSGYFPFPSSTARREDG